VLVSQKGGQTLITSHTINGQIDAWLKFKVTIAKLILWKACVVNCGHRFVIKHMATYTLAENSE
jgi:hypothetical protein